MATANELGSKVRFGGRRGSRQYHITDVAASDAEGDARTALLAAAPSSWVTSSGTLTRQTVDCDVWEMENEWYGIAPYQKDELQPSPGQGESRFRFQVSGVNTHLKNSIETIATTGPGPTNFNGAINVQGIGDEETVEGVDIITPTLTFVVTRAYPIASVDSAFLDTLADAVGSTNHANYQFTTDDGIHVKSTKRQLLLMGCDGGVNANGDVEIQFTFGREKNVTLTSAHTGLTADITKTGWEYLWMRYKRGKDGNNRIAKPHAALVERVYPETDFTALGFGSTFV